MVQGSFSDESDRTGDVNCTELLLFNVTELDVSPLDENGSSCERVQQASEMGRK